MSPTTTTTPLPPEMLAAQLTAFNTAPVVQTTKTPSLSELGPYDLLLRTAVASLCHTDLMVQAGFMPLRNGLPMTLSHEGTGVVVATGDAVPEEEFKVGDRVMSGITFRGCGKCENCLAPLERDWRQYCFAAEGATGVVTDGAFAEFHVVDARSSCKVPDEVGFLTAAPLACAGVTVYRALKVSGVVEQQRQESPAGDGKGEEGGGGGARWIGIVGAGGGLGHFAVQFAKAAGLTVVAVEARDEALAIARKYGADHVLDARAGSEKVLAQVRAITPDGAGVDATINVSDHASSAALAASMTRSHGTVVQAAQPPEVTVRFEDIVLRDVTIKGTAHGGKAVADEMLATVARHGVVAETQIFNGLGEVPRMFELLHKGEVRGKAVCVVAEDLV
ncbi:hypothetical protein Z517_11117 [Fonsecaea pedrosoi CBS 271.37]|uniref:Unplaced genomic scaffold supercont1.7, whole genome shotgun sequence n=1 Tax=Fonsecaea pedrosoi CBS 271.37 TaxID=1442368 RepID=A0A0D2DF93_9EURO|nr:uncharacterized protein Z517_11117 [Fonsecaea pedrosoi CBS 271.37]KIW76371.1 hypothetical protein Z517_11117 [Fonsecaea pedrosoi CBS 271.37]